MKKENLRFVYQMFLILKGKENISKHKEIKFDNSNIIIEVEKS